MAKVYAHKDEPVESVLRRWRKKVEKEGIMEDLRKKDYYKKPSTLRREKQKEAEKKAAIQAKKMEKVLNKRDK